MTDWLDHDIRRCSQGIRRIAALVAERPDFAEKPSRPENDPPGLKDQGAAGRAQARVASCLALDMRE